MNSPLEHCLLCPHACGSDRLHGSAGRCGAGAQTRIYRYAPHDGEEPPVSGTRGSGTIFFSHCTLSCIYCQNYPWSHQNKGDLFDVDGLADILKELAEAGCHNWNLVSPTPWLPMIQQAVQRVKRAGITLPLVYNTSGFEAKETLERYSDLLDIALVDLRYASAATAAEASGAPDYVKHARETLMHCWETLGPLRCDADGIAERGVICRLLILPGHADELCANLEWIERNLGNEVPISVMSQYTPVFRATEAAPWNRRVVAEEYDRVCSVVEQLGFETGWIQELQETPPEGLLGCTMQRNRTV